jgi:hypothetical protein
MLFMAETTDLCSFKFALAKTAQQCILAENIKQVDDTLSYFDCLERGKTMFCNNCGAKIVP